MLPAVLLSTSCKTTKTAVDSRLMQEKYSAGFSKKVDTVFIYGMDSVIVRIKGDTVFMDKIKNRFIYRTKSDTVVRRDSIRIDRDIFIESEKGLSWWAQMQMKGFWILAVILLLIVIYTLIKKRLKK